MNNNESKLSQEQETEIALGILYELDVAVYNHPSISAEDMRKKRFELLCESPNNNKYFKPEQLEEIKKGIDLGIDVSLYAYPIMNSDTMRRIREEILYKEYMQHCIESESKIQFSIDDEDELYDEDQKYELDLGIENGVDITRYDDPNLESRQMCQIRLGLEAGVDVTIYNKTKYDWEQMIQLRLGLQSGDDDAVRKRRLPRGCEEAVDVLLLELVVLGV